jgi:hypothetical protein
MLLDDYDDAARVLVAIVPQPRDLALAHERGWYRIPVARAPQPLAAELLAFYLPSAFGAARWAIRQVAPILGYEVVLRRELLPEEAAHPRAGERYYLLRLGALIPLPRALPARRLRRISFISSTLGQLRRAEDVVELWQGRAGSAPEVWGAGIGTTRRR